jgi:hypothetical protein
MSRQAVRISPMSTAISPASLLTAWSRPAWVSTVQRSRPVSAMIREATQRVAFPQASTSPPSALRMRMKTSAAPFVGGSMVISWSQPTPTRRSATARAAAASRTKGSARASTTTKSLPRPCIFVKGRGFMLRVIGRATRPV